MGKSNRIRADRAKREVRSLDTKKTKKGMPSWMMTVITVVLTLAILLSVAGLLLASNGVFNRWARVLSTEHFKVNANMMSYYFHTQYQNFLNDQQSSLSYFSLDTTKSLKDQPFGGPETTEEGVFYYDELFLGEYEGTWFDYFMDQTVTSVSSLLVYCEAAYERGVELGDEENAEIDANLAALGTTATTYGYATIDAYISAMYGDGVKEKDVRRAMEYSALATKAMTVLTEEISDGITENAILSKYIADPKVFDFIDFSYYKFEATYDEAKHRAGHEVEGFKDMSEADQKVEIEKIYKEMIEEVKENAKKLTSMKNVKDVNEFIILYISEKEFHTAWEDQSLDGVFVKEVDGEKVKDPAAEKQFKTLLVDNIAQEILSGKTDATKPSEHLVIKSFLPEGISEDNKKKIDSAHATAFKATLTAKETYVRTKAGYAGEDDEFSVWAFEEGMNRDTYKITEGKDTDAVTTKSKYSQTAYFLAKAPYRDENKTKNVAYMLFTNEEAAKKAVDALKERGITTLDEFEALAEESNAEAHTHLEDYVEGSLNSSMFDTWLYADGMKVGDITDTPLALDSTTFCVALYYGEGHASWYVTVKNQILSERFDETVMKLTEKYPVDVKEKALDRVDA
ncbi:MAG: hypothetical protein IJD64_06480 [Clostridia bacterium]|nr:hypothetical protein [Clostridia bacterium]